MSKLQLQDAVDVGRHTLETDALYWPRLHPTDDQRREALDAELIAVLLGSALALLAPTWIWSAVTSLLALLIWRGMSQRSDSEFSPEVISSSKKERWMQHGACAMFVLLALFRPQSVSGVSMTLAALVVFSQATLITIHYAWYVSSHHNNTRETEQKWRTAFASIHRAFPKSVQPARDDLSQDEQAEFERALVAFRKFARRGFGLVAICAIVCAVMPLVIDVLVPDTGNFALLGRSADVVPGVILIAILARYAGGTATRNMHARMVYLHSPAEREPDLGKEPGWSAESPFGSQEKRRRGHSIALFTSSAWVTPWFSERLAVLLPVPTLADGSARDLLFDGLRGAEHWSEYAAVAGVAIAAAVVAFVAIRLMFSVVAGETLWHAHRILDNDSD